MENKIRNSKEGGIKKVVVVYYSRTGKTKLVAEEIARVLNGDIIKIEEIKKRKGFLGFIGAGYDAIKEKCSEIKPVEFSLDNYDLIFLGTPVWASRPTPAINTFISKANFKDKKVIIFVTMAGIGGKRVVNLIREKIEGKGGTVINSFAIKTFGVRNKDIIKKIEEITKSIA